MDIIDYSLEGLKFLCIYVVGFHMQLERSWKKYMLAGLLTVLVGITVDGWKSSVLFPVFYMIYAIVLAYLLIQNYSRKNILITFWATGVIVTVDVMSNMFIQLLWQWLGFKEHSVQRIGISVITLCILYVVFWFVARGSKTSLAELSWWYYIAFLGICIVNICVLAILEVKLMSRYTEYAAVFILLLVGFLVQMTSILVLGAANNWYRQNEALKEQYINLQDDFYRLLQYKNEETRKFRHDVYAHFYIMRQYIKQESIEQLNEYMDQICDKLDTGISLDSVHNGTVDALLNYYGERFRQIGCELNLKGRMPGDCFVEPYDLCVIFSNILGNALEAVCKAETKWVKLEIRFDESCIYIAESNSCNGVCHTKNGRLVTSKEKSDEHGIGMENIIESVRKYHGTINWEMLQDHFVLQIIMENTRG